MKGLILWNDNLKGYDVYKYDDSSLIYPRKIYVGSYETFSDALKICSIFKFDVIVANFEFLYSIPAKYKLTAHATYRESIQEWELEIFEIIHIYDSSLYGIINYAITDKISIIYINLTDVKEQIA